MTAQRFPKGKRRSISEDGISHKMDQFYPMKAVMESLFGHRCYMKLKEAGDLNDWKHETHRLLRAIEMSVATNVEVADPDWRSCVADILELGHKYVGYAESIADLFAYLSATLTRLVFLQLGLQPEQMQNHRRAEVVPIIKQNWRLNQFRSVQYVQNSEQAAALESVLARGKAAQDKMVADQSSITKGDDVETIKRD